jgi:hypothetical protein
MYLALVEQFHALIPLGAQVVLLGDGVFDGTHLRQTLQDYYWFFKRSIKSKEGFSDIAEFFS